MYSEAGNKSILSIDSYHLKVLGSLHFVVTFRRKGKEVK